MLTLVRCIFVLCEVCNGGVDVKFLSHATDVGLSRALDMSEHQMHGPTYPKLSPNGTVGEEI